MSTRLFHRLGLTPGSWTRHAGAAPPCASGSSAASAPSIARSTPCSDRKSTRLNSSHRCISYAVFCVKKQLQSMAEHLDDPEIGVSDVGIFGRISDEAFMRENSAEMVEELIVDLGVRYIYRQAVQAVL